MERVATACRASPTPRIARRASPKVRTTRRVAALLLAAVLAGCGGGGSGGPTADPGLAPVLRDTTPYSSAPDASLPSAEERAAVTAHSVAVAGAPLAYTATAGHLNALAPVSGAAQASLFYVAYTVTPAPGSERPLMFFFNGGPGSATVWLHLGSFAPRRIVTDAPSLSVPQPFQLVDNAETLLDAADLVFVDAVGSGYSQAIAPFTNRSFWGVDSDAGLMRDFIARYRALNGRQAAPTFVLGESYGSVRAAVLAELMVAAGMPLDGVVLLSSILDYNANCAVFAPAEVNCEGFLPSYGMTGAWFGRSTPVPADADAYAEQLRSFAATSYRPAAQAWVDARQPAPPALLDQLVDLTGMPLAHWQANVDLDAGTFRRGLIPGQLLGRYDARFAAPLGSALAAGGDPSSTVITAPFVAAADQLLAGELGYAASARYTLLSNAIASWDFSHDGRALPDAIPDLLAALTTRTALRVLSLAGHHDLATPFRQTELDLARLGAQPGVTTRVYPGGHMIYLDNGSRVRLKADLAAFIAGRPLAAEARSPVGPPRRALAGVPGKTGEGASGPAANGPDARASAAAEDAAISDLDFAARPALPQGGDPVLPPALRRAPAGASPSGPVLDALVRRKIAARGAAPGETPQR